jgi:hypothetical protein
MGKVGVDGYTRIGTNLSTKVLKYLVYEPLRTGDGRLKRPVLVLIITDGEPTGENYHTLKDKIVQCGTFLEDHQYDRKG